MEKGFILPSQIVSGPHCYESWLYNFCLSIILNMLGKLQRYVKYFEHILTYFNGENQPPRRYLYLFNNGVKSYACVFFFSN
jgi:hypothetical protein